MLSINVNNFAPEGGIYTIQITDDEGTLNWSVTPASVAWVTVERAEAISSYLYELRVVVDPNESGSSRSFSIAVQTTMESEFFTISQGVAEELECMITNTTPSGNIGASGGNLTVDVESVNGNDSLTGCSITTGSSFVTLVSTTHNVSSGGTTVTRFVFSISPNTSTSSRSFEIAFTASDGSNSDTVTLSKSQAGANVQQGSINCNDVSHAPEQGTFQTALTLVDMNASTLAVSTSLAWLSSVQIQVVSGVYAVVGNIAQNTGASRSGSVTVTGTDIYGNSQSKTFTVTQQPAGVSHGIVLNWKTYQGYDGVLDYQGGREDASISYAGTFTGDPSVSFPTLPSGVEVSLLNNSTIKCTYTGGEIAQTVRIPITVSRTGNDNVVYTQVIYLTMQASGVSPIWADKNIEIPSDEDFEDYSLEADGEVFYSGRAFKYPDEDSIRVNIARVVAPYLTSYYKDVKVIADATTLALLTFVRDYSYDPTIDYAQNQVLNRPINGKIPSGIVVSASEWGAGIGGSLVVSDEQGNLVINQSLAKGLNVQSWISGTVGKRYTLGSAEYEVVDVCRGALLKYVNAYGAMDYFLVEGVCKKEDKITRSSYEKDADALSQDFQQKDYQAEMEATWNGHTGWLTDSQSKKMKHLVESVEVYMIDLETGDVWCR